MALVVKDARIAEALLAAEGVESGVARATLASWEAALATSPAVADHTESARWLAS